VPLLNTSDFGCVDKLVARVRQQNVSPHNFAKDRLAVFEPIV
jgi:hypothetical protein